MSKGEQVLWQNKYLQCCEELNQWDPVQEYARVTEHYGLLMDCLWRAQDWTNLKQDVLPKALVSSWDTLATRSLACHLMCIDVN